MLALDKNGNCIYLSIEKTCCTIHDIKPRQCREMDCRNLAQKIPYTKARKMHKRLFRIWQKGRELIKQS